jgi:DNA-binding PadR family transcriptional regulator
MHGLEKKGLLRSKERVVGSKIRRLYSATVRARKALDSAKERVRESFGEFVGMTRREKVHEFLQT